MTDEKDSNPFEDEPGDASTDVPPLADGETRGDGWEPVEEDGPPDVDMDKLRALMTEDSAPSGLIVTASGIFDAPVHSNPIPEYDEVPQPREQMDVPPPPPASPDSNEAILQGGRIAAESTSAREKLPSRADSPTLQLVEDLGEARTASWLVPGFVTVSGVGAGGYVFTSNPILGGIAVALSVVGALFLRVLLSR